MDHAEEARLELAGIVGEVIDRAKAQGALRDDFDVDDMPALMCSIGGVMSAQNSRVVDHWKPMIEIVVDGLRARR
jgi:hypothetical protein